MATLTTCALSVVCIYAMSKAANASKLIMSTYVERVPLLIHQVLVVGAVVQFFV